MCTDNPHSVLERAPRWVSGYSLSLPERIAPVKRVTYSLRDLVRRDLLDRRAVAAFSDDTHLADFAWRLIWAHECGRPEIESIAAQLCEAWGVLVFLHGWDGSGDIWEGLPALAVLQNPGLLALVPDINGFGGSPFRDERPPFEKCHPPAAMAAVEHWLRVIGLHPDSPSASGLPPRPIIFVGHSMGGAALFFLDDTRWRPGEVGRIAAAPALLLNDRQRQTFYRALGTGIQLSGLNEVVDRLTENLIAPRIIDALAGWGSPAVREEHRRIYKHTPESVIARTFTAMGLLDVEPSAQTWADFLVYLAHKDRLVGLQPMLELLEDLHFSPAQIRVALGDHYFFSLGSRAALHAKNRALLLDDIGTMARSLRARLNGR